MDIAEILTVAMTGLIFIIIILFFVYWFLSIKNKNSSSKNIEKNTNLQKNKTKASEYTKIPIFNFMEFDSIEDNMIVQNGGKRFLMVIECEGVNYDLMSEIEKVSVEAGFVQFLNTLRHPIQIYTQTRTINIGHSIENYNTKIETMKHELEQKQTQLNKEIQSKNFNSEKIKVLKREIARTQNLYDYGKDVVQNIEKISLNKNVLKKHYYIVVPYYASELGESIENEEEKKNMVFSELYTRCQSINRTLFACSIRARVLNSNEMVELLYVAYNRDESEVYSVEKALKAGYTELFSKGQDSLDKKMEAINTEIEKKAVALAQDTVEQIKNEKERNIYNKQKSFDEIVKDMAERIIEENKKYIGEEVAKESIQRIEEDKTKEKGGKENEEKAKTTRRKSK